MFDFDPYKSRMILTTPGKHDYWFRITGMTMENIATGFGLPIIKANADLEFEREEAEGTRIVFSPNVHPIAIHGGKYKARRVVFNPPATVVLWEDGTKTVVKCDERDGYDAMTGVALCYMKKALGNTSRELNKALRNARNYMDDEGEKK